MLRVTVSIGVATLLEGESVDRLLQRADEALYLAKHAGRNQVHESTPVANDVTSRSGTGD